MKTDDFDYFLPDNLIAQTPLKKRDSFAGKCLMYLWNRTEHKRKNGVGYYLPSAGGNFSPSGS